jgi:hypothetical protein
VQITGQHVPAPMAMGTVSVGTGTVCQNSTCGIPVQNPKHQRSFLLLGLNTGAGKLTVFPKRVSWVRVQSPFLAHRDIPLPVPWYCRYVQVNHSKVILIFTVFVSFFFSVFFQ